MDATRRFSRRAGHYARYRPTYPEGLIDLLASRSILKAGDVVADVGSGTGRMAELFLRRGHTVYGVEPNGPMRAAGEESLGRWAGFHSVEGRAESTGLPSASVDLVTAGQAFHWFEPSATRAEFLRILKPGGRAALVWNERQTETSPFMEGYEALLRTHGTDYAEIRGLDPTPESIERFFGGRRFEMAAVAHHQDLDFEGLRGRLLSSSYVPEEGAPAFDAMMRDLDRLWKAHGAKGSVCFLYDARVWFGVLKEPAG